MTRSKLSLSQSDFPYFELCSIPYRWKLDAGLDQKVIALKNQLSKRPAESAKAVGEKIAALRKGLGAGHPRHEYLRNKLWKEALLNVNKNFRKELSGPGLVKLQNRLTGHKDGLRTREISLVQKKGQTPIWKFPQAQMIPALWKEFWLWREHTSGASPWLRAMGSSLILRCIHPFPDGNGRLARMLEYADILRCLENRFLSPHPELIVHTDFAEYLKVLRKTSASKIQNPFFNFMLDGYLRTENHEF